VESGKTDAEEIDRTAKIKHTQNKQRKNNTRKNQNQKTGRTNKNKIQWETKQEHGNKTPNDQPERLGQDLVGSTAGKVAIGERRGGDAQMTCHRWRATKTPRSRRPKQGKKPTTRKKKGRGKRKKKGRDTGTRASSK
jgi:hypothetical protein